MLKCVATELRTELYETADIDVELERPEAPGKEAQLSLKKAVANPSAPGLISLLSFQLLASSSWLQYLNISSCVPMTAGGH